MTLIVPNVGDVLALQRIVNFTATGNLKLHLFVNSYTPAKTDTVSSYIECSATGYAAISLTGASWSVTTVSNTTTGTYPAQTFTLTSSATIYGYYVTESTSTTL